MSGFDLANGIAGIRDSDPPWQLTMIAIGFAESQGDPHALGDFVGQRGVNLPPDALEHSYHGFGAAGEQQYTSIGLWQINMAWNWQLCSIASGLSDPQEVGDWLQVDENNGIIANAIYEQQGFGAWSTYTSGAYLQYTGAAQDAFNQYPGRIGGYTPPPGSGGSTGPTGPLPGGSLSGGLNNGDPTDWSGSIRVSTSSVSNMGASAVGFGSAFRSLAQGS